MTRGIVVGARIDTTGGFKMTGSVEIEDVLGWILYWDQITYAGIGQGGGSITGNHLQDISYLESAGVFRTEVVDIDSLGELHLPSPEPGIKLLGLAHNQFAVAAAAARIHLSRQLSDDAGNIWTVGQSGGEHLLLPGRNESAELLDVKLVNCLPVPALGTSFEDVLEFRNRYQDELLRFRSCLDQMRENILSASDQRRATDTAINDIARSISDIRGALQGAKIETTSETIDLYIENPALGFWTPLGGVAAGLAGFPIDIGLMSGMATASAIKFLKRSIVGGRNLPENLSEFAYVFEAAKQLDK